MNAVVTRNRKLISRSGSHVRAADGVARGGDPLAILFFFFAKSVTFRGVFLIDVIYFTKWAGFHPLAMQYADPPRFRPHYRIVILIAII